LNPNGYSVNPDIAAVCIPGKKDDSAFLASMVSSAQLHGGKSKEEIGLSHFLERKEFAPLMM
jgi:hypothetical protein